MKKYYILFLLCFLFSCTKKQQQQKVENNNFDSLTFYLNNTENNNFSDVKKQIFYQKAFNIIRNKENDSITREKLLKISLGFYNFKKWNNFLKSSDLLLNNSLQSKDTINLAQVYRYKAGYYKNTSDNDSAFIYYLKAEKLFRKLDDKLNLGNVLNNISIVQFNNGDYVGADRSLTQAYSILKSTEDYQKIFNVLNMMGVISHQTGDYEKAIEYYKKALKVVEKNGLNAEEHPKATCLNNIGKAYQNSANYKEAINNYKIGLNEENLSLDTPDLYSLLIDNLAYSKFKLKDYNGLPEMYYEALRIRENIKSPSLIILSRIHLSEYYDYKKDSTLSKKFAIEALSLSRKTKDTRDVLASLKQASNVDNINSSKFSKDYIRISDSINEVERKSQEKFARLQLETDEIIQEKDQLVEKNRNILNYFLGAILIGGLLFFVRIQRSRSRELVLKQSQQQANEEIYRLIISHQNQLEEGRDLEKRRLSKELHDGVLGRLFGLRLNLDGLNNSDDESSKQQRLEYLNELQLIEQDLRDISHELNRENLVLINNFVAIINNLLEQQAKINPAKIKSIIADDIDWEIVPNTAKINLYRILQEALQNINKHAEAKNILIHFRKDKKGNLLFNIEDDGKGYDMNSKKSKGIGMKNIVSRTQQCNGIIDIKSEMGKGSKIIITFPLENKTIKV